MNLRFRTRIAPKNPWHLVWISVIAALVVTTFINIVQSFLWYGEISQDLMIIGTIDAILVTLIVAPFTVKLGLVEQQRIRDILRELAITDDLTKLNNRRGFYLLAEQILKIASRTKIGVYLMYADMDGLKKINDTYGHDEGDRALQAFSRLLKENYRKSDIIARIGGDEFVVLPVGTSKDGIQIIRNRFVEILASYNNSHDHPWTLSATAGISYYDPESPCSLDELLKVADESLYKERKNRR